LIKLNVPSRNMGLVSIKFHKVVQGSFFCAQNQWRFPLIYAGRLFTTARNLGQNVITIAHLLNRC